VSNVFVLLLMLFFQEHN